MKRLFLLPFLFGFFAVQAQTLSSYLQQHKGAMLEEYVHFLAIPNVSSDTVNILKNAAFIQEMMQRRGIKPQLLHSTTPGVTPAVYGEIKVPGATRTLGFYAHYDGQPVNPKQWHPGLEPFTPLLITAPMESGGKIIGPYKAGNAVDDSHRI